MTIARHNPAARTYLDPVIVRSILDACIARGINLTVYVDKKDGTATAYNGHPNPHKSFVGGESGKAASERLKANDLAFIKRPARGDKPARPASFYVSKVRGIKAMGQAHGDCTAPA